MWYTGRCVLARRAGCCFCRANKRKVRILWEYKRRRAERELVVLVFLEPGVYCVSFRGVFREQARVLDVEEILKEIKDDKRES